jgi:ectoine hydroxylase-related dioxygenase (phytanoyl-CoA dioxygenase family)
MKKEEIYKELEETGISFIRDQINQNLINKLKESLDLSLKKHRDIQIKNNSDVECEGVALNLIGDDVIYLNLLEELIKLGIIGDIKKYFFKSVCILNSFSGLNNLPLKTNFSANIHRDSKFFSNTTPLMLNILIMLDDFTPKNGPTLLLPYSHKKQEKPSDEYFYENAIQAIGKSGDILLFNADIWHASSTNKTDMGRRALPLTFSKSFIKQLMDYPRYIGYKKMDSFSDEMQTLLGYHSRVAANLNEWYMPYEKRFYKKNQD